MVKGSAASAAKKTRFPEHQAELRAEPGAEIERGLSLYKATFAPILPPLEKPRRVLLPDAATTKRAGEAMYAVFKTGGKQYRVAAGDKVRVEKLPGNVGDAVAFQDVLLVAGDTVKLGRPVVGGAKVEAKIVGQGLGQKIIIFKFRRRKNYRRKTGHRQPFTALEITNIVG